MTTKRRNCAVSPSAVASFCQGIREDGGGHVTGSAVRGVATSAPPRPIPDGAVQALPRGVPVALATLALGGTGMLWRSLRRHRPGALSTWVGASASYEWVPRSTPVSENWQGIHYT